MSPIVWQAQGVFMELYGLTDDAAMSRLETAAAERSETLEEFAREIVDQVDHPPPGDAD